jgi:alkylation response protein AidB-like acyl-CoA dehydrogenase
MAMQRVKIRTADGKPVIEHQVIQLKLSEMSMLTEALRSFVMRVAWERDRALPDTSNNVLVMNYSTEVIQRVTHLNMEIHGAAGFTMDAGADKLVRDGIIWTHLAGDTVQRIKVVKRLMK